MIDIPCAALNGALAHPKIDAMNFLNEIAAEHPDAISFAPGRPREELFRVRDALAGVESYLRYRGGDPDCALSHDALGQYGRTNGIIGDLIARLLHNDQAVRVHPDHVVVTVGCQEAMFLCLLALCRGPDDVALISEPAYVGMSGAARVLGIEVAPVQLTPSGIEIEALRGICDSLRARGKTPRLLYLSADFANPTGISLPLANRVAVMRATRELGLLVVEDDAYGYFSYDDSVARPLKSLPDSEHVIYLGSFSKTIFPGLRVGFLVADQTVAQDDGSVVLLTRELSKIKSLLSVNSPQINQAMVGGVLIENSFSLRALVDPRRLALQHSRDAMLAALERHFPRYERWSSRVSWCRPSGGFFLRLRLPFAVTQQDLMRCIERYEVIWTPMSVFCIEERESCEIRLSFSYVTPEQIERGIAALAAFVKWRHRSIVLGEPL
jgi:(S)-3,5-dihydroxyphenylglycine transaminase